MSCPRRSSGAASTSTSTTPTSSVRRRSCSPRCPASPSNLADQIARIVRSIRQLELKKAPSVSARRIDWARTLVLLGIDHIDAQQAKETLHILLKYQTDIAKAAKELAVEAK